MERKFPLRQANKRQIQEIKKARNSLVLHEHASCSLRVLASAFTASPTKCGDMGRPFRGRPKLWCCKEYQEYPATLATGGCLSCHFTTFFRHNPCCRRLLPRVLFHRPRSFAIRRPFASRSSATRSVATCTTCAASFNTSKRRFAPFGFSSVSALRVRALAHEGTADATTSEPQRWQDFRSRHYASFARNDRNAGQMSSRRSIRTAWKFLAFTRLKRSSIELS